MQKLKPFELVVAIIFLCIICLGKVIPEIDSCVDNKYGLGAIQLQHSVQVPRQCLVATCLNNMKIIFEGCGSVANDYPFCQLIPENYNLKYPECCPHYVCTPPSDASNSNSIERYSNDTPEYMNMQ